MVSLFNGLQYCRLRIFQSVFDSSPSGSIILVEAGIIQMLASFQCIDHPLQSYQVEGIGKTETGSTHMQESWCIPVHERYERILLPVIRLMADILTQLPKNSDVASQIVDWLETHSELVSVLLKDRIPQPSLASVRLLVQLTAIFYHMVPQTNLVLTRLQVQYPKHQKHMVALWIKYSDFSATSRVNSFLHSPQNI